MSNSQEAMQNFEALAENPYPGRGIVVGQLVSGNLAQVYWVMGRSAGSRNRQLQEEGGIVHTVPFDESMVDPAQRNLIIYTAMQSVRNKHIVSNGQQTDDIVNGLSYGETFGEILKDWTYEPDAPNFTPRISGIIDTGLAGKYELSIIRKSSDSDEPIRVFYRGVLWGRSQGIGRGVHTYLGNGDPLPAYDKDPVELPLGETADDTAEMYWEALNAENIVALVVKEIDASSGEIRHKIINKL